MKTLDFIKLDEAKVSMVVSNLQQLLADFQVYYTNLRGFHWNIKGQGFITLHERFEELYNNAAEKVDEIAERILTLGGSVENRFSEYLKVAKVEEVTYMACSHEILKRVLETLSYLMEQERKVLSLASDAQDEGTVAMMSDYIREQEKLVWMLVASVSTECSM